MIRLGSLLLVLSISLLSGCGEVDEPVRLKQALDELVGAVKERSVVKVNRYLTTDFKPSRQTGVKNIQSFMLLHFRSNAVIHILTSDIQLVVENGQGQISFNALVTGSGNWLPERGRRFFVKTAWKKVTGDWKLDKLDWEGTDSL